MSRRGRAGGAVRGPSSALTSFLAGLGVEPSAPLTTWGNTAALNADGTGAAGAGGDAPSGGADGQAHHLHLAHDGPMLDAGEPLDPAGAVTARTVEAGPSRVGEATPEYDDDAGADSDALDAPGAAKRKRRRGSVDSDDLDAPSVTRTASPAPQPNKGRAVGVPRGPLKPIGEHMLCGECGKQFSVTAYTKEHPAQRQTYLCIDCTYALGLDPFEKPKKAAKKKAPAKKEERGKVVHYEERRGALPLGDMCIELIGKCIEDVEQLGDIGGVNLDKVCKIISKSRRLTPETAALFYSSERQDLVMYDCTRLVHESYLTLARLCPNLTSLHLQLCGQLQTDSIIDWSTSLPQLERLELFAPFLVRKEGWIKFFETVGARLKGFLITQSPRFDLECCEALVNSCSDLTELRLCEVGKLNDDFLPVLAKLSKLQVLDLSSPSATLSDDAVIALLDAVGSTLVDLRLADHLDLSDAVLTVIAKCANLTRLSLRNTDLSDAALADFFRTSASPGFTHLDLEKGHELGSATLGALVAHSAKTLVELSILGWKDVGADAVSDLATCEKLEKLNLGWCRNVTDYTLKDVLDGSASVREIRVWGCNQLTDAVPRKKGVKVIGIETHSI
ncbi:UV-damaged DNA-binding protein rad7 [Cryptotrichosporon argae]